MFSGIVTGGVFREYVMFDDLWSQSPSWSNKPILDGDSYTPSGGGGSSSGGGGVGTETDPVFSASPAAGITTSDINNWNSKATLPALETADNGKALIAVDGLWEKGRILPAVTAADNGKVLKVVSGAWAKGEESGGGSTVSWGTESNNTVPLTVNGTDKTLILSSMKVTFISSSSTDNQVPSAKCVYDLIGDIETLLAAL